MIRVHAALVLVAAFSFGACEQVLDTDFSRYRLADGGAADGPPAGCSSTCGDGTACGVCPAMFTADLGSFQIDSTEVTQAQYQAFLEVQPTTALQPPDVCGWNTDFHPATSSGGCTAADFDPASKGDHPVVCIDWCDAAMYCAWARKRLCGRIGGGAVPFADYAQANVSQWFSACSSNGGHAYPYGEVYDEAACDGGGIDPTGPAQVKQMTGCHGVDPPWNQLYDLSGNVWEWEDSCNGATGQNDYCRGRGGSFLSPSDQLRCDADFSTTRATVSPSLGFRCCEET